MGPCRYSTTRDWQYPLINGAIALDKRVEQLLQVHSRECTWARAVELVE